MHVTPDVYALSPNVGDEVLSTESWVILVLAQLLHQIRMAQPFNSQLEPFRLVQELAPPIGRHYASMQRGGRLR